MKERSVSSAIAEQILKFASQKDIWNSLDKTKKYIEKRRKDHLKPYIPPKKVLKATSNLPINGFDVYMFKGSSDKVILYLHGGAFIDNPIIFHWEFIFDLQKNTNATIYVPIYPKLPEYNYLQTFELLTNLYQSIIKSTNPENITIMGDSAGGNLSLAFPMYLRELKLPQPKNIILLSPCLDITFSDSSMVKYEKLDPMLSISGLKYLCGMWPGELDINNYKVSPINGSLSGLGKITIFIGTHELLLSDARRLKEKAKEENIKINYYEYPKMNHVFVVFPVKEGEKARNTIYKLIGLKPKPHIGEHVNDYAKKLK